MKIAQTIEHGHTTIMRRARMYYFESVNFLHGHITCYPRLPAQLYHHHECLALLYPSENSNHALLVYTGKKAPSDLCTFFGWRALETSYAEEVVA